MARLKKGQPKPGKVFECSLCGEKRYVAPSQIKDMAKVYRCISCKIKHAFYFNCLVCGTKVETQPSQMHLKNRKTCSHKCKWVYLKVAVLEKRKTYTKHQLDRLARYSKEAGEWREAIFERDNYTCQVCSIRGTYLEADHIKPWAYFPELRYELTNGRTLCRPCHDKTKMSAKKMREIYGKAILQELERCCVICGGGGLVYDPMNLIQCANRDCLCHKKPITEPELEQNQEQ